MSNLFSSVTVDETEADVSATTTILHYAVVTNPGASLAYVKLWNEVAANIDPATDAPDLVFGVPAGATITSWLGDVRFQSGCCIGATTQAGVGAGAVTDLVVALFHD